MFRPGPSIPKSPRGTLKRFFPKITEIVDLTTVPDQMKIFDTLGAPRTGSP